MSQIQDTHYQTYKFNIPAYKARSAILKLQRLSARAVKLNMPEFDINVGESLIQSRWIDNVKQNVRVIPVAVHGGVPILKGWRFLAKIEHDPSGNEVQGFGVQKAINDNPELFKTWTTCPPDCDHCQLKRKRNITFVFEKGEGGNKERMQIGNSCVDDFSGHKDPGQVLAMASSFPGTIQELADMEEDAFGGGSSYREYDVKEVFAVASALIRHDGRWVSREHATESGSSADWIAQIMTNPKTQIKMVIDKDRRVADAVEAWLTSEDFDAGSNMYLHNLQMMAHRGHIKPNLVGFAGSAVASWGREKEKIMARQQAREKQVSMTLGEAGEKIALTVQVEKIIPIETFYGTSRLHIMRDTESGAKLTWFNSGARKFYPGDTYEIGGRVKKHDERDGIKETQLTRVNSPDMALHNKVEAEMKEDAFTKKARKIKHINARDGDGDTLLHTLSNLYRYRSVGKSAILDLIERGADPSILSDRDDCNAFDYWVDSSDAELIQTAIERFPELSVPWTNEKLEAYDLLKEPWAPALQAARDEALANPKPGSPEAQNSQHTMPGPGNTSPDNTMSLEQLLDDDPEDEDEDEEDGLRLA